MMKKPTKEELQAAAGKSIRDVIAPNLDVLFCGINPGLYSGATGHHFAKPGNRFWPALHKSGFTAEQLDPSQKRQLLDAGCGVTNLVMRTTASMNGLNADELRRGGKRLATKIKRYKPRCLALLGVTVYRTAFDCKDAQIGLQRDHLIGDTKVWVLPNPSGLNAHYQMPDFVRLFRKMRRDIMAK